jgi:hypothetical protein
VLTSNNDGIRVREGLEQYEVDGHLVRLFILGLASHVLSGEGGARLTLAGPKSSGDTAAISLVLATPIRARTRSSLFHEKVSDELSGVTVVPRYPGLNLDAYELKA